MEQLPTLLIMFAGSAEKVYAICDDGVNAYWVTNQVHGGS
jgi:hypothetical protein